MKYVCGTKALTGRYKVMATLITSALVIAGCSGQHSSKKESPAAESIEVSIANPAEVQAAKHAMARHQEHFSKAKMRVAALQQGMAVSVDAYAQPSFYHGPEQPQHAQSNSDKFASQEEGGFKRVLTQPVSTFSVDVDTGSYATMRRWINQGRLPQAQTIRIEELINYFNYQYPTPDSQTQPFSVATELAPSPYSDDKMLLRVGLQGYEVDKKLIGPSNLVFLMDVSGSMNSPDKLPLLKQSLLMLAKQLSAHDKISIVVYAGASGVVLDGIDGNNHLQIANSLAKMQAGGSTHGSAGIQLAYQLAQKHFIEGGVNRVILATDGDFNVGTTDQAELEALIQRKRKSGIQLTTLGFGQGNYNDHLMEQLADKGNGQYAYIDTLSEARKVLVDEISSSLLTIAQDVKIQIEFNPNLVAEYRLIGYQNRLLKREDFNNDKVDAGDIGAGHSVTALYELALNGSTNQSVDPLRYVDKQTKPLQPKGKINNHKSDFHKEIAFVKLRYKPKFNEQSILLKHPVYQNSAKASFDGASTDFRFAASVAGFGQLLNQSVHVERFDYANAIAIAQSSMGEDPYGYRHEFVKLIKNAELLSQANANLSDSNHSVNSAVQQARISPASIKLNPIPKT
ncbi:vWA domain-containing protein [Shewanella gelidii]|uniref:VWFA domain-containing protein n=1 Tax=Shewanella gelidii TaxID=1642821 RepID=A0A917N6E1_9GAMM|nr:VWA domain-containing protein [Shewanella gelidii]MCL1096565.1 VWA domain-containing protein [Shewanella gelidii]GGI68423.1 hypothetical protein GCM10009332_01990 [Shewanella gelidii]